MNKVDRALARMAADRNLRAANVNEAKIALAAFLNASPVGINVKVGDIRYKTKTRYKNEANGVTNYTQKHRVLMVGNSVFDPTNDFYEATGQFRSAKYVQNSEDRSPLTHATTEEFIALFQILDKVIDATRDEYFAPLGEVKVVKEGSTASRRENPLHDVERQVNK